MRIKNRVACACIVATLAAAGWATMPGTASARQSSSANSSAAPAQGQNSTQNGAASTSSSTAQDPLAAAARKAKEQKNQNTKPAKVFTNDNLPSTGISTVGSSSAASDSAANSGAAAASSGQDEKAWRDKFASLNKKLDQDQEELGIMQRELGQLNMQNYSDPNVAMQQGYSRSDINKKTSDIDAKQKEIEADKQAISDAEEDLRKSGGNPGWAR